MVDWLKRGTTWMCLGKILFLLTLTVQVYILTLPAWSGRGWIQGNYTRDNQTKELEAMSFFNDTFDYEEENYTDYSNHSLVLDGSCHSPADHQETGGRVDQNIAFVLEIYIGSIIGILGIAGNICTIWILSRRNEFKAMFHRLLQWLALSDLFFISFVLFLAFSRMFRLAVEIPNMMTYFILSVGFASTFMFASEYITLAISLERFLGVCYPLRKKSWGPRNSAWCIVPVIIWSVIFNSPRFFCELTTTGELNYEWANDLMYVTVYKTYLSLIFTDVVPLLGLIFLNGRIWLAMQQSRRQMSSVSTRDKKEQGLGSIIVAIVISFFCTHACRAFLNFYMASVSQRTTSCQELGLIPNHPAWMSIINAVSSVMVLANCFNNFLIYCFVGSKFRISLFRSIRTCCGMLEDTSRDNSVSPPNMSSYSTRSTSRATYTSRLSVSSANRLSVSREILREDSIERKTETLIRRSEGKNGIESCESIGLISISEQVEPTIESRTNDSSEWL